jgi:hypothetical protein
LQIGENGTTEQRQPSEPGTLCYRKSSGLICGTCRLRKVCALLNCRICHCVPHLFRPRSAAFEIDQLRCRMCELHHADCRYDKAPPMSQLVAMAKRLQEAEQAVAAMSARTGCRSSKSITPHGDSNPVDIVQHSTPQPPLFELPRAAIERVLSPREANRTEDLLAIARSWEGGTSVSSQVGGRRSKT